MAKRELIDKALFMNDLKESLYITSSDRCKISWVMGWRKPITEEEIVKPYLEKLNEHIINFPWGDTSGDFMTGVKAVYNLIDNLLTEKGAEE